MIPGAPSGPGSGPGSGPSTGSHLPFIPPRRRKLLIIIGVIIVGLLAVQGAWSLLQGPPDTNPGNTGGKTSEQPLNAPANAGMNANERQYRNEGRHCINPGDGHHFDEDGDNFSKIVLDQLPNATGIKIINTKITPLNSDGHHGISMEYHYPNANGNMVKGRASGKVHHVSCKAELLGIN